MRHSVRIAHAQADAAVQTPYPTTHHEQDHDMAITAGPNARAEQTTELSIQNRTLEMHLLQENLARAHMQERLQEAEDQRLALRAMRVAKLRRKAERASLRARKVLATAVL
ncbi:hypothetical protein C7C46_30685 [Streptomyces tateyamensis]|uniref:Uncharacterized protein n=2 Tax=Streptomyces tateyamensis TaxID=565073 RepID=A0A2V4MTH1_9ACTN|nr:hypothetical protein C7C46_30685 [Streptomyces tateyamensis]